MNKVVNRTLSLCIFMLVLAVGVSAQSSKRPTARQSGTAGSTVIRGTERAAVIVVGTAGKAAWSTTKFTAKYVVAPAAVSVLKPVIVKGAPHAAGYLLKNSAKYMLPLAVKLSLM